MALGREGKKGKDILPSAENPHTQTMEQRLRSEEGQRWYRQRKWLAEPPFGWIKHVLVFFGASACRVTRKCEESGNWSVPRKPEENRGPDYHLTATGEARKRRCDKERKSAGQFRLHCTSKTIPDRFSKFPAGQTPRLPVGIVCNAASRYPSTPSWAIDASAKMFPPVAPTLQLSRRLPIRRYPQAIRKIFADDL